MLRGGNDLISSSFDTRVVRSSELTAADLGALHRLFDLAYAQANHAYLDKSLATLRFVSIAVAEGDAAGFALGDVIETELPGLAEPQIVHLAGICCIAPRYRRMGLFGRLESLAAAASNVAAADRRRLVCGRMAHPASFRGMSRSPATIPKLGVPITDWQREIALRVAALYRVTIDPETLVVIGDGTPIGYSNIEQEVADEEWLPFAAVDRDRGDSLLAISWAPDAPEGWWE